jgi:hypothetical protein
VTLQPSKLDPADSAGELPWGDLAGTHWWTAPAAGLSRPGMNQRRSVAAEGFVERQGE